MIVTEEVYLEHFGVKGMKWGVYTQDKKGGKGSSSKNEPSLKQRFTDRQTRIKADKAAALRTLAKMHNTRIGDIKKELASLPPGVKNAYKKHSLNYDLNIMKQAHAAALKKATKIENSRLTPGQKKAMIGAAAAAGVLAAVHLNRTGGEDVTSAIRRLQSQREHGSIFEINKEFADKSLSPDEVLSKVAKNINPNYSSAGGKMNCRRATFAYELRRRGYNVDATTSQYGKGQSETGLINALTTDSRDINRSSSMSKMIVVGKGIRGRATDRDTRTHQAFTQAVKEKVTISNINDDGLPNLRAALAKMPNGSRGEVVFNETRYGHSMAWEIFDGKAHIYDTQKGQKFSATKEGLTALTSKWGIPEDMAITRLDNVDLDLKFLSRWATNSAA